jgi:imidazolonepropionase-like amidohydrolase
VQKGVKLTMGTDTGVFPHADAPKQLAYMVQYGMTPMQAIQAATKVGAEALGIEQTTGQIAPGYAADIVAVTRNPLDDIHAMDNVEFVMKQGTVYKQ